MPGIAYRINTDLIGIYTERQSFETETIIPVADFKFQYTRDRISGRVDNVTVKDNQNETLIININSDDESIQLYGMDLEELKNQIRDGIQ
jgi:hypothetical protein